MVTVWKKSHEVVCSLLHVKLEPDPEKLPKMRQWGWGVWELLLKTEHWLMGKICWEEKVSTSEWQNVSCKVGSH